LTVAKNRTAFLQESDEIYQLVLNLSFSVVYLRVGKRITSVRSMTDDL